MKMKKILLALALTAVTTMNSEGAVSSSFIPSMSDQQCRYQQFQRFMEQTDDFFKKLSITDARIKEALMESRKDPRAVRVLVVGITGSGKSTLVNSLYGNPLEMRKTQKKTFVLDPRAGENVLPVGAGSSSITQVPGILYDKKTGIVYCDCPGFGDTAGAEQEALNAFAIDSLFSREVPISAVYVINYHDTESERYSAVKDSSEMVFALFNQNAEKLGQCLSGVVSRIPADLDAIDQINELKDFNPVMSILHSDPSRVFSFPEPDRKEDKEGEQYNKFVQKDALVHFIQTHAIRGMDHTVPLSKDALDVLIATMQRSGNMIDFPARFGEVLRNEVEISFNAKDIKQLDQWLRKVEGFRDAGIKNIDDFEKVTRGNLPPVFDPFYSEIEKIQRLGKFVSQRIKNPVMDRVCGQEIGERLDKELKNVESAINLRREILRGSIGRDEGKRIDKELEAERQKERKEDKLYDAEYESMVIRAGDDWGTRFAKNFRQVCHAFKDVGIAIKEAGTGIGRGVGGFGTMMHNFFSGEGESE